MGWSVSNDGLWGKHGADVSGDPRAIKCESHCRTTDDVEVCAVAPGIKPATQFEQCVSDLLTGEKPTH